MDKLGALFGSLLGRQPPPADPDALLEPESLAPDPLAQAAAALPTSDPSSSPAPATNPLAQAAVAFSPAPPPVAAPAPLASPGAAAAKLPTRQDVLTENAAGLGQQEAGIQREADAKAAKASYVASQHLAGLQQDAHVAELLGKAREDIQAHAQDRMGKINAELDALSKSKPGGNDYWKDKGVAGSLLAIVGVALSGLNGPNGAAQAMNFLNAQADRHAQEQTRAYQQKIQALDQRRGVAKEEQASALDALEFKVTRQVDANNRIAKMIDASAAQYDSPEIQARAQQMKGELQQKNAALLESVRGKAISEGQEGARISLQAKGLALDSARFEEQKKQFDVTTLREIAQAQQQGDLQRAKLLQDQRERAVFSINDPATGKPVQAADPTVARELNKKVGAADEAYNAVDKIFELRQSLGVTGKDAALRTVIGSEPARRIEEEMGNLKTAISKLTEQGVITTGDAKRLELELGDPLGFRNPDQLRQLQGTIVDKVNSAVRKETGAEKATWRQDADPTYAQSVRAPGWKPDPVGLPDVPNRAANVGGQRPTKEQRQQQRAEGSASLKDASANPPPAAGPAFARPDVQDALSGPGPVGPAPRATDPLAELARALYGR